MSRIAGLLIGGVIGLAVASTVMYAAVHSSFYTSRQALNSDPAVGRRRARVAIVAVILIATVLGALFGLVARHLGSS